MILPVNKARARKCVSQWWVGCASKCVGHVWSNTHEPVHEKGRTTKLIASGRQTHLFILGCMIANSHKHQATVMCVVPDLQLAVSNSLDKVKIAPSLNSKLSSANFF